MAITLKTTGSPDTSGSSTVQVKTTGKGYDLFENGQKMGTLEDNTLGGSIVVKKQLWGPYPPQAIRPRLRCRHYWWGNVAHTARARGVSGPSAIRSNKRS